MLKKVLFDGVAYVNVTPHPITLQKGEQVFTVEPSGVLINARPEECHARTLPGGIQLVRTAFVPDPASAAALDAIEKEVPGAVVIGSIIAAQAFPGRVFAMVPVPGFERVPPEQKRMRADKFTTF
ncbi:MAG: hypothetical protein ACPLRM_02470 [Anaerolineae bacterium]